MKKAFLLLFMFVTVRLVAQVQTVTIVPEPVQMELQDGKFILSPTTAITTGSQSLHEAKMLNLYLNQLYGFTLPINYSGHQGKSIILTLKNDYSPKNAYRLKVSDDKIEIISSNNTGLFYGIQTLLQLLPPQKANSPKLVNFEVPAVSIYDYPRFAYRGMHLDVGRHFFDVDFVKKYIDYLAFYKFNTFHWHLTEDQGWRIEIKKYPKLTSIGGYRNGTIIGRYPGTGNDGIRYGGYYTREQIKDVVKYAADRHITIIPEIEMPGHASAAIAAYPQLSCFPDESTKAPAGTAWAGPTTGKQVQQAWGVFPDIFSPSEYTFHFLEDVLDEVMELFPSQYIHIGGDEAPKDNWKRSAFCQKLMKEKGLKNEHELQSYFIQRIEKYLNSKGRKIIGWDEILEGGLAPNATVMSWRGEDGGIEAAKQHHDVIMTPGGYCYFDHKQSKETDSVTIGGFTPLKKVYLYQPIPEQLDSTQRHYVLGAQANVWTEYMKYPSKVEYMIFPRMSALSEVLWSPASKRNWDRFVDALPEIYKRYQLWGTNYFKGALE